jgi:hypothetical protein
MAVGRPSIDYAGQNLIEMSNLMNTFSLEYLFHIQNLTGLLLPKSPQISTSSHTHFQAYLYHNHNPS